MSTKLDQELDRQNQSRLISLEQGFYLEDWLVLPHSNTLNLANKNQKNNFSEKHIESKHMQVLLQLACHKGEFVSRESLFETVWKTRFVTDDVLTGAIAAIRKALNDDPKNPHFIETRRGVGYRLITDATPIAENRSKHRSTPRWLWVNLILLVIISGYLTNRLWLTDSSLDTLFHDSLSHDILSNNPLPHNSLPQEHLPDLVSQKKKPTIAVLPFADYSPLNDKSYLADAVTETLIQQLAELQTFRVISRTSVTPYKVTQKNTRQIAQELGIDLLVEGSVLYEKDKVRVTTQLIDANKDIHLWTKHFDRSLVSIFPLINDIAREVAIPLSTSISHTKNMTSAKSMVLKKIQPAFELAPQTLETYLMARYLLTHETTDSINQALEKFTEVAHQAPDFFGGHLGKAQSLLALFKFYQLGPEALNNALVAVERSITLNPTAADNYRCRGQILFLRDLNYKQAEADYLHGITLNSSDYVTRRRYAWLLVAQGRYAEADEQLKEIKYLNPLFYADTANALLMLYAGQADQAINDLEHLLTVSKDTSDILSVLSRAYLATGRKQHAAEAMLKWLKLQNMDHNKLTQFESQVTQGQLELFYKDLLEHTPAFPMSPLRQAVFYLQAGEPNAALERIEKALHERDPNIAYLPTMPNLKTLHAHPRYQELLKELKR